MKNPKPNFSSHTSHICAYIHKLKQSNPIQSNQNSHNLGNKKWPCDSREKAWMQLCWIKMRREFLTCWGVSSVYRITCWSVRGPLRRRFSHTFCIFFFKKKKTKHNVLDTERQVYMFRFYREKEIFTATRLPKWLVMRCTANLMPYGVAIVWFLRILLLREMRGEWVRREGGDVMWFYYSRV